MLITQTVLSGVPHWVAELWPTLWLAGLGSPSVTMPFSSPAILQFKPGYSDIRNGQINGTAEMGPAESVRLGAVTSVGPRGLSPEGPTVATPSWRL